MGTLENESVRFSYMPCVKIFVFKVMGLCNLQCYHALKSYWTNPFTCFFFFFLSNNLQVLHLESSISSAFSHFIQADQSAVWKGHQTVIYLLWLVAAELQEVNGNASECVIKCFHITYIQQVVETVILSWPQILPITPHRILGGVLGACDSYKLFLNYLWSACLRLWSELEDHVQSGSLDISHWILLWQMAEKQRYKVNVFPTALSAAEPQEAIWGGWTNDMIHVPPMQKASCFP